MRNEEKTARRSINYAVRGTLFGYISCIPLLMLAAYLVSRGSISENGMRSAAAVCVFLSAGTAGFFTSRGIGRRRLLFGAAAGGLMFLISVLLQLLINASGFPNAWTAVLFLAFTLGGAFGGILSALGVSRRR